MKRIALTTLIKAGITLAVIGGIYALLTSLIWPNTPYNTILAMMLLACGSGLAFPILGRLAIEASTEPMGARVAISSALTGAAGMFGSAVISSFYNGALFSLGAILFVFSVMAVGLQYITT